MIPTTMRAWRVHRPGPMADNPLELAEVPVPAPGPGEVLVQVSTCGVCRTGLHVSEGDLPQRRPHVTPGHEVVGRVVANGEPAPTGPATRFQLGDRIGVAWLGGTCGSCRYCRSGRENLCRASRYTGWDNDGGYAEYLLVNQGYAYRVPEQFDDVTAAPLLCAGIIGYRALRRAAVPPGGRLGLYGFGGSAHLTAQLAIAQGMEVHVLTRGPTPSGWRWSWVPPRPRTPEIHRRCPWIRRSCSPRSATSSRTRLLPWRPAGRWRWRASTCPTSST